MSKNEQQNLFSTEEMNNMIPGAMQFQEDQPVVCLGREFPNDEARREYFREELRKKLPELRKIEGFPIGSDEDIIRLSDPPYYTACPNPWLNDFIAEWEKEKQQLEAVGKRKADFEVKEPYASDVSEGKSNPIYMAHAYHTKVPHPAIMRYVMHYTQPGDIIFDGFAGTGMTGVAAGMCNNQNEVSSYHIDGVRGLRHCILGDLSPIASFITYNFINPVSIQWVKQKSAEILNKVKSQYGYLYQTKHNNGEYGVISYVIWSDKLICPNCGEEISYWKESLDESMNIKAQITCPHCGSYVSKNIESVCSYYVCKALATNGAKKKREKEIICTFAGPKSTSVTNKSQSRL